jgi:steroid 5-alpha reductase family enzyme
MSAGASRKPATGSAAAQFLLRMAIVLGLALAVAAAGSHTGASWQGWPVFALCALLALALQWLAFVPAWFLQTEKFYDLTGSCTYLAVIWLAVALSNASDPRSLLLAACISLWALRLGSFLFLRILKDGSDSRFDQIKPDPGKFLFTWSLQGLWVLITAGCALAAISSGRGGPVGLLELAGLLLWLGGFAIEVIADRQKRAFRHAHGSERFIDSGLWAYSRHPNYCGEILLWCGIALMAAPALAGMQWLTLISPLFVFLLLTRVSGIPLLERKAKRRWGNDPAWQAYQANTPVLMPRPWR